MPEKTRKLFFEKISSTQVSKYNYDGNFALFCVTLWDRKDGGREHGTNLK